MKVYLGIVLLLIAAALLAVFCWRAAEHAVEIKFDVGKNIHETAKNSGVPRFATRNIAGLISYKINNLPADIPARYIRTDFEIKAIPLFAFTLYADEESKNGLAVEAVVLQFDTDKLKSHATARAFVGELIAQFNAGRWARHIDEFCPAVTGRSVFLDEAGEPRWFGTCSLDPHHRLSIEDWKSLMSKTQTYQWVGDGVLAKLSVRYGDIRGIIYSVFLEFDDIAIKTRRDEENWNRTLAEGDANGWNSTEDARQGMAARRSIVKVLERNAQLRGDAVIPR